MWLALESKVYSTVWRSLQLVSDAWFIGPGDEFLRNRLVTNKNAAETFVYLYNHRGAASLVDIFPMLMGVPSPDIDLGKCRVIIRINGIRLGRPAELISSILFE